MSILSALMEWQKDPGMQPLLERMSSPLAGEVSKLSDRSKSLNIAPLEGDRIPKVFEDKE